MDDTYIEMGILKASPDAIALFDLHRRKPWALRDCSINNRLAVQTRELWPQTCSVRVEKNYRDARGRERTHGFANISTQQLRTPSVITLRQLDDAIVLVPPSLVEIEVDDVNRGLSIVHGCANCDAKNVTKQLIYRPSSFGQFLQKWIAGLAPRGSEKRADPRC